MNTNNSNADQKMDQAVFEPFEVTCEMTCHPLDQSPFSTAASSPTEPVDLRRQDLMRSEAGMMTWSTIFAVFVLLVMFAMVANSVDTVTKKVETQNAADSVAYSSTAWLARGMNAVTATNHIIGELNALYAFHHSLGGKYLDDNSDENDQLELEFFNYAALIPFYTAKVGSIAPLDLHQSKIEENPVADINSMIYEAKLQLKEIYLGALVVHAAAALLEKVPIIGPAFILVEALMFALEWKLYQEYLVLDGVELLATSVKSAKKQIPNVHKIIYLYQQFEVIAQIPLQAYFSADKVAKKHGSQTKGYVRGDLPSIPGQFTFADVADSLTRLFPKLPIEKEDTKTESRSQMLRATYPWVAFWRERPITFLKITCTLSGAGPKLRKWSNQYAYESSEWLRLDSDEEYEEDLTVQNRANGFFSFLVSDQGSGGENGKEILMYVMLDLNEKKSGPFGTESNINKSEEEWNKDSYLAALRADTLFSTMGFATRPKPSVVSKAFFRQENPNGFVCYSQAILYNANPQQRPAGWNGGGQSQPTVGWDTLNWTSEAREWPWNDDANNPPRIKLNWQAKLTPLTTAKMTKVLTSQLLFGDSDANAILINNREAQLLLQNH